MRSIPQRLVGQVTTALLLAGATAAQSTWYVDASAAPPGLGTQARPYASIQYAIDQSTTKHGDTLLVAPGEYVGNIHVKKALDIRGSLGPDKTILVGEETSSFTDFVVTFTSGTSSLEGVTIHAPDSALVIWGTPLTVRRCVLIGSQQGHFGVAIFESIALTLIETCTLAGFTTGIYSEVTSCGPIQVDSCVFADISEDLGDGGTWCDAPSKSASSCAFDALYATNSWLVAQPTVSPDLGLWAPAQLDVHLEPLSPCIDQGNPMLPPDPDGSRADVGAYPYDPHYAESPTTYCTGKRHSAGCVPHVSWSGEPSLSGRDDFVLVAQNALSGMSGKFIWSTAFQATPFAGGTLCVAAPFVRGPLLASGGAGPANCSGAFVWPVTHAYMQAQLWQPGQVLYAQAWGRDIGSAFPEKSQLSDAIVFQVLP
jgi:hypothetical protein